MLINKCVCGNTSNFSTGIHHGIPTNICGQCGVIHQRLDMTPAEYYSFYSDDYHTSFQETRGTDTYAERYTHDTTISEKRINKYTEYLTFSDKDDRHLDIGSSNNAFVDVMNKKGYKTYGLEIGQEGQKHPLTTYTEDLLEVRFPPEYFIFITMHDVLEHIIEPVQYLKELYKILTPRGTLVIDIPHFFVPEGVHHWKPTEHLWMPTLDQARVMFADAGFVVDGIDVPIPSKAVFYLSKQAPTKKPVKMLFMPGMGDIYWGLTKVESFIKKHDLGIPEAYIWDIDQKQIKGRQRSEGYLDRISFLKYCGTLNRRETPDFQRFYDHKRTSRMHNSRPPVWVLQQPHHGEFDYMFNMNGLLEVGHNIETAFNLKNYETNWHPHLFTPIEEKQIERDYKERFGKYIVAYFTGVGCYDDKLNKKIPPKEVYGIFHEIYKLTGCKVVLIGTTWDAENSAKIKKLDKHNIIHYEVGKTNTSQMYALMKQAAGVMGWPAGNTIMATYFKTPTIMIWSGEVWNENFAFNCISPEAHNNWYFWHYADHYNQTVRQTIIQQAVQHFRY